MFEVTYKNYTYNVATTTINDFMRSEKSFVDDFYKNPDEVRDYALSCERTNDKEHCGGLIAQGLLKKTRHD